MTSATAASAQDAAASRSLQAQRVESDTISIDGHADDAAWKSVPPASGFTERDPAEGTPPSEQTTVRAAFDDKAFYVLVEATDSKPGEIAGFLTQRDLESASDWVEVWLDPQNDHQTGYRFAVNARGIQLDSRFSQSGTAQEVNWHAVWRSAVRRHEAGWTVEMRIPFSELRYDRNAETWGIQIVRRIARENETSTLEPMPKAASRPLLHMARLDGLESLPRPGLFAVRPYGLIAFEQDGAEQRWIPRVGGDLRLNLGASTTLQLAVLPDFGQVEQDPSQLNLGAFEIYQTERRQFFLDGRENLVLPLTYRNTFNEQLYYSRRIGQRPHVTGDVDSDEFTQYPEVTSIAAASKVLGRTQKGLNYSVLSAVTEQENATFERDGESSSLAVGAPSSFNVARVRQEVQNGRGYVGAVGTYVHRFVGEDLDDKLVENAAVGGAEFDLRSGDYGLQGQLLGSHLQGSPEAIDGVQRSSTNNRQRPDAGYVDYDPAATQLSGYGLSLTGGKFDGSPWRASWGGHVRSSGFNTNDMGFLLFADQQKYEGTLTYRFDQPTRISRFASVTTAAWVDKTNGPELTAAGASLGSSIQLRDNSDAWLGFWGNVTELDTRRLRGGPAFQVPPILAGWWGYHSDQRRSWDLRLAGDWQVRAQQSASQFGIDLTATVRPTSYLSLSLAPAYRSLVDDMQYVDTEDAPAGATYYLGHVAAETYSLTLRADWALAVGLTLRAYAQSFASSGRYSQFYRVTDPRNENYFERRTPVDYDADDSFSSSELRSTLVLRWDYLPGSFAYLVWTHRQGTSSDENRYFIPGRDLPALFSSASSDVIMLKANWFWSG